MASRLPVDAAADQLNPSMVLLLQFQVDGLDVLIPLQLPLAPVLVRFDKLLLLVFAVPGEPVSIITCVPVPASVLFEMVLPLIFTVVALEALIIPLKTPDVAVEFSQFVIVLLLILIVFAAAVPPMPLSIALTRVVVPPPLTVTVLLLIVALALVPDCA